MDGKGHPRARCRSTAYGVVVFACLAPGRPGLAADVRVRDAAGLKAALRGAGPGTRVLLAPGEYAGGLFFSNLSGAAGKPIVIGAQDPASPPRIRGGTECL